MTTIVSIIVGYIFVSLLVAWCFGRLGRHCDEGAMKLMRENQQDLSKGFSSANLSSERIRSAVDRDRVCDIPSDTVSGRNPDTPTPTTNTGSRPAERLGR